VTPDLSAEIAAAFGAPADAIPLMRDLMPPPGAFRGFPGADDQQNQQTQQTPGTTEAAPVRVPA
jgi:hypothetical protein